MKAQNKSGFCHNLIICCEIYQIWNSSKRSNTNIEATYNSSIIIATHMSYNYFPCLKGRSINNIRKYLLIFRATLITVCCLCSYICTVDLEAGNRVCSTEDILMFDARIPMYDRGIWFLKKTVEACSRVRDIDLWYVKDSCPSNA